MARETKLAALSVLRIEPGVYPEHRNYPVTIVEIVHGDLATDGQPRFYGDADVNKAVNILCAVPRSAPFLTRGMSMDRPRPAPESTDMWRTASPATPPRGALPQVNDIR
jgi:hypothetical protein